MNCSNVGGMRVLDAAGAAYSSGPGHTPRNILGKSVKHPDLGDFVWIAYSFFFFIEPIVRHNRAYWIGFAGFYVIFAAIYAGMVFTRKRWQHYALLAAWGVLGALYFPQHNEASGTFIFVAAFVPFVTDSLVISVSTIALASSAIVAEGLLLHINPWSWVFCPVISLIVGGTNLFTSQRARANAKLEMAHEEIEQLAKMAERERIARDLHDVLGHTLSVIVLKSELAGRLFSRDPQRAAAEIADVEMISRKALGEVREAIRGYRAEGLAAEIKRAQSTLDAAGVSLVCEQGAPELNPAVESVVSLVVREAVTNIVRHAQASQCEMTFSIQNRHTSLVIEDDGRGGVRADGNGIRGMRERVEALGGQFTIDGTHGTRLTILVPTEGRAEKRLSEKTHA
ncbi:MAG: sensor histidine kinase [Silvibacterium sp.]|nr:sensor histidine kinase [Silvibacterium sp.]